MSNFKLTRNRDAWFVIRGYKYQVDLSILRWLSIKDGQTLVLEFGEDIDIVNNALSSMIDRELEQIKHLDTPITLRTPASKTALANAVSHFFENTDKELLFRFCTNASVTTEQPSPFKDRSPAIEIWEKLRNCKLKKDDASERLNDLIPFLRDLKRPKDTDNATWKQFVKQVDKWSAEDLQKFIDRFEWSTQLPNANDIVARIQEKLVALEVSATIANDVYARLFLYVMQKISQRGIKNLKRDAIDQFLKLPKLNEASQNQLAFLNAQVFSNTARISVLEVESKRLGATINEVKTQMLQQTFGETVSLQLTNAIGEIQTELPPVVEPNCSRATLVADVKTKTINKDWLAIYGSLGSGKTQLATLLGRELGSVLYVSFRDLTSAEAVFLLHHLFRQLSDGTSQSSPTRSGLETLEVGTAIFLDDVPRLVAGDNLSKQLTSMAKAVLDRKQTLVTLSHFQIPKGITSSLGSVRFEEIQSVSLNTVETKELFVNYGASQDAITDEIATSFVKSTKGNPTLLAAHALNMRSLDWKNLEEQCLDSAELVLGGELIDQTMQRLLQTASDLEARELLYRHCVILGQFSRKESSAVAEVDPAIACINEHLAILQGPWLEKQTNSKSVVCPLIAETGAEQLKTATKKGVAGSLAELIIARRLLDPIEFAKLVHYLKLANEPVRLALCLLGSLDSIETLPLEWKKLIATVVLEDGILDGCPTSLALLIRAHQIKLASEVGAPFDQLIEKGQQLVAVADEADQWAVSGYAIQVAPQIAEVNFDAGIQLCEFVVRNFAQVIERANQKTGQTSEKVTKRLGDVKSVFSWFFVTSIKDADQFSKWLDVVSGQDDELVEKIFSADMAAWGMQIAVDRLWQEQHELPKENQDFVAIHAAYDRLIGLAKQKEFQLIGALAVRAKIVVLAEYEQNLEDAVEIAQPYLDHPNEEVRFLINDILGRQYKYADQNSQAIPLLEVACGVDTGSFDIIRFRTLLTLAKIVGDASDTSRALNLCEQAVGIAKRSPNHVPELELIVALGEAANAAWLDDDRSLAFQFMDQAFVVLERTRFDAVDQSLSSTPPLESATDVATGSSGNTRFQERQTPVKEDGVLAASRALQLFNETVDFANLSPSQVPNLEWMIALEAAANAADLGEKRSLVFRDMDQTFAGSERTRGNIVEWKMRYTLIGNALGYMASMLARGAPPDKNYVTPQRGHLLGYNKAAAEWYDENKYEEFDVSLTLMVMFATASEEFERASYWANKGLDKARKQGMLISVHEFAETLVPKRLEQGKYIEAVDLGLEAATAITVSMVSNREGKSEIRERGSIAETLGSKPSDDWNQAEQQGVFLGVLPAVLGSVLPLANTTALSEIRDYCRVLSGSASAPAMFEAIVDGLSLALDDWQALPIHDLALERNKANDVGGAATLYALSSLAPDAPLEHAVLQHLVILHSYVGRLSERSSVWVFVCNMVSDHWQRVFKAQRFLFSMPSEIEDRLKKASRMEPTHRIKSTIQSIISGLRISVPESIKVAHEWTASKSE